ncbi:hypothetical protein TNCV_4173421 [Trichonephila clavipes]|nr:hypothetical protein TNCV_4173421 [Trichonephila clavipes]
MNLVNMNLSQVKMTTPELTPSPNFHTTPIFFILDTLFEAQWQSGYVSPFHATDPGFKNWAGQGRLSLSSFQ